MKNLLLSILFLTTVSMFSQTNYSDLKAILKEQFPNINLENKIIIINKCSDSDVESQKRNEILNKTASVYENAKLNGGSRGLIGITVSEKAENAASLSDPANKLKDLSLRKFQIKEKFIVFDSNGNVIYQDLNSGEIFKSIHKLVTR